MRTSAPNIPAQYGLFYIGVKTLRVVESIQRGAQLFLRVAVPQLSKGSVCVLAQRGRYIPAHNIHAEELTLKEAYAAGYVVSVGKDTGPVVIPHNIPPDYTQGGRGTEKPKRKKVKLF